MFLWVKTFIFILKRCIVEGGVGGGCWVALSVDCICNLMFLGLFLTSATLRLQMKNSLLANSGTFTAMFLSMCTVPY